MEAKLQQYLTTLETLRNNANEQEQEALDYVVNKLRGEAREADMKMLSS